MDGMTDRGSGRVINVSSVNGSKGAFRQTNYSAAKAGMHGFTLATMLVCEPVANAMRRP
jgi:acetoacetyl-CoA reductase